MRICKYCEKDLSQGSATLELQNGESVHFACELRNNLKLEKEGKCFMNLPPEIVERIIEHLGSRRDDMNDKETSLAADILTGLLGGKAQVKVENGHIVVTAIKDKEVEND